MMDNRVRAIEKVIYNLLCERFSKEAISKVVVKPDHDSDGDPVLRVVVVLEVNKKVALDSRKMVGLVRHIRSKLDSEKFDEFPMVSFVSKKEAGKLLEAT